jgi:predicted nucleotidyltransferase
MITMQLIQQRKHEIMQIAAKYGAHNLRVFGSVARGEAGPDSDLDLLVDFEPGRTLFDLGGLLISRLRIYETMLVSSRSVLIDVAHGQGVAGLRCSR